MGPGRNEQAKGNGMSDERVSVTVDGGVADVRLNRPDKMNAIDPAMFRALSEAATEVAALPGLRAVVLSGNGRGFCAGLDIGSLGADGTPSSIQERTHGIANLWQHAVWGWRELPVPVIAAVHGVAFGGGLQVALAADIRIVAPDARLAVMEARWGLVPDMAGIALLRGLLRDDVARELTYTARQVSGTEAVALGLATRTAGDPRAAAAELAAQIAAGSPRAVRGAKRLFALAQDDGAAQILQAESREQEALLHGPDLTETVTAHMEGRPPRFAD
jgi:enoyl-CoA hydratase/carnithine racemase